MRAFIGFLLSNSPLLALLVLSVSMSVMLKWLSVRVGGSYSFSLTQGTQILSLTITSAMQTVLVFSLWFCCRIGRNRRGTATGSAHSMVRVPWDLNGDREERREIWTHETDEEDGDRGHEESSSSRKGFCNPIRVPARLYTIWRSRILHTSLIGCLLGAGGSLLYIGAREHLVSGSIMVLLQQISIPLTFIISITVVGDGYTISHMVSCVMVTTGVVATVWPMLGHVNYETDALYGIACITIAVVFHVLASMYMDRALLYRDGDSSRIDRDRIIIVTASSRDEDSRTWERDEDTIHLVSPKSDEEPESDRMGILTMWMAIGIVEVVITIPLMIVVGLCRGTGISDSLDALMRGYECLLLLSTEGSGDGSICGKDTSIVFAFHALSLALLRIDLAVVIRQANVVMMWIVLACAVPISVLLFSFEWVMGKDAATGFDPYTLLGTFMVLFGTITFRFMGNPKRGDRLTRFLSRLFRKTNDEERHGTSRPF